jgi:hypothetical protein
MRPIFLNPLLAASAAAASMAACASPGAGGSERAMSAGYGAEIDRLRADCEARGGTLIPTGRISGTAALDYPCRIRDASAIPPRG